MKILTSLFVGTCMLVGSALAAQSNQTPKPAASTPATQSAQKSVHSKTKHRTHKKATTSKMAKKSKAPVAPVATKKKPAVQ